MNSADPDGSAEPDKPLDTLDHARLEKDRAWDQYANHLTGFVRLLFTMNAGALAIIVTLLGTTINSGSLEIQVPLFLASIFFFAGTLLAVFCDFARHKHFYHYRDVRIADVKRLEFARDDPEWVGWNGKKAQAKERLEVYKARADRLFRWSIATFTVGAFFIFVFVVLFFARQVL